MDSFRVLVLGFSLGHGFRGLGSFRVWFWGLGNKVLGALGSFRVLVLGFRSLGLGGRVLGLRFGTEQDSHCIDGSRFGHIISIWIIDSYRFHTSASPERIQVNLKGLFRYI